MGCWEQRLLRPPAEAADIVNNLGLQKPHLDEVLRQDPRQYARFLASMFARGLVDFTTEEEIRCEVGLFFVAKYGDKLRIIVDTRKDECPFR